MIEENINPVRLDSSGMNLSEVYNLYLAQEQNNVLEAIMDLELRKEKKINPWPARISLNVCLKILILRMDPFLRKSGKNRDELINRIKVLNHDQVIEFYNELAEVINLNINKRTIL